MDRRTNRSRTRLCSVLAVLTACVFPSAAAADKEAVMAEIVLGQADSGRRTEIAPGSRIIVQLPENPSTGYSWQLEPVMGDAVTLESNALQTTLSAAAPGAGGSRAFVFLAQSPGTALLRLHLKRPWEAKAAAKTFEVTVQVVRRSDS